MDHIHDQVQQAAPRPRRPLPNTPTPPPIARPNTPSTQTQTPIPIPPSSFYGTGSASTLYVPPAPEYNELQAIEDDDPPPPLTAIDYGEAGSINLKWGNQSGLTDYNGGGGWGTTTEGWGITEPWDSNSTLNLVPIDGRSLEDEETWWDRERLGADLGPGILPPVLADQIHDPDHTLFSVMVRVPDNIVKKPSTKEKEPPPAPTSEKPPLQGAHIPPTPTQTRGAVPHPNAYYCPKHNSWILLSWKSSSVVPPLKTGLDGALPDQERRKRTGSCVSSDEQFGSPANKTHHFHYYARAVEAGKMSPPYRKPLWETEQDGDGEDTLLDLYMCCQCSFYCVVSTTPIPGIIPNSVWTEFVDDRLKNPNVGLSSENTLIVSLETLLM